MDITVTTPALLFPAISLLLLAYTNRFLTLATLIRDLHSKYKSNPEEIILAQIKNLRYRVYLIRNMQIYGVASFFLCVATMLGLFFNQELLGEILFGASLILLLVSLAISLREVQVSVDALDYRLSDIESFKK